MVTSTFPRWIPLILSCVRIICCVKLIQSTNTFLHNRSLFYVDRSVSHSSHGLLFFTAAFLKNTKIFFFPFSEGISYTLSLFLTGRKAGSSPSDRKHSFFLCRPHSQRVIRRKKPAARPCPLPSRFFPDLSNIATNEPTYARSYGHCSLPDLCASGVA